MIKKYSGWILAGIVLLYFIGRYMYAQPKYINGAQAPDFSAQTLSGSTVSLSQLKGNYVLLDFWGSWCGPCLTEAPHIKALYDKFHGKTFQDAQGFEVMSVGIESDSDRWKAAIQRLNLNWQYHVSDFKNLDSPIAQRYGVRVIPTKFLLNTEGVIIGVNQSPEEIDKILSSHVKF